MSCKKCGGNHRGWERCIKPVNTEPAVNTPQPVLTKKDRHSPGYMAEYMRKWRAKQKA